MWVTQERIRKTNEAVERIEKNLITHCRLHDIDDGKPDPQEALLKDMASRESERYLELNSALEALLKEMRERFERIEHGQSVLKADRDADIARMTDRDIAFGEEFLAMSRRLDAIELSQCKTLSLLAVSVKSPAKSAKKRSKKP